MAISYIGAGAIATGAGSLTVAIPAHNSGDMLVLAVGGKPDTITINTPTNWTAVADGEAAGGGGTTGIDTGPTRGKAMHKLGDGVETSVVVTFGGNNVEWAQVLVFRATNGFDTPDGCNGIDSTTGTPFTAALSTGSVLFSTGDHGVVFGVIPTDVSTPAQFSAETITATGCTFTVTEISEPDSSTGNDIGGVVCRYVVDDGDPAAQVPTFSATAGGTTTNVRGPIVLVRLHESAGGTNWTQNVDDTLSLADAPALGQGKSQSETLALGDALALGQGKVVAETLALADGLAFDRGLTIADTLALADVLTANLGREVTVDDTLALADGIALETGKGVSISDALSLADALSFDRVLVLAETLALADALAKDRGLGLSETLVLADALAQARGLVLTETLALADEAVPAVPSAPTAWTRDINDVLLLTDFASIGFAVTIEPSPGPFIDRRAVRWGEHDPSGIDPRLEPRKVR